MARKTIVMDYADVLDLYKASCIGGACDHYKICQVIKNDSGRRCGNSKCLNFLNNQFEKDYAFSVIFIPYDKEE